MYYLPVLQIHPRLKCFQSFDSLSALTYPNHTGLTLAGSNSLGSLPIPSPLREFEVVRHRRWPNAGWTLAAFRFDVFYSLV